ncbi:MAG: luciferase family protein [Roseibium sp.]
MKKWLFLGRSAANALIIAALLQSAAHASDTQLSQRSGPVPTTTNAVPHFQIGAQPIPEVSKRLLNNVAKLPGVEIRATVISLPGAKGFWLGETLELARPDAIVGGREFAHLHPDGSLHATLPPDRARQAVTSGWATPHPWANSRSGWEGFVLIYTPRSTEEADVVFRLILDGYNFVTGQTHRAAAR